MVLSVLVTGSNFAPKNPVYRNSISFHANIEKTSGTDYFFIEQFWGIHFKALQYQRLYVSTANVIYC
jgi:hypothetical protein